MPSRRLLAAFLAVATAAGVAALGLPEFLTRQSAADTCLGVQADKRCVFLGGPLEMEGQPVFLDGFNHAFLAIKGEIDFIDANGVRWTAPPRTLTDGATIPQIFAPLVGDRQSREYLMAAALHDAYCGVGNDALPTWLSRRWEDVHRMFYEALLVNGTPPLKAKVMFAAVYLGGPRWDDPARDLSDIAPEVLQQELIWCLDWIALKDPPVERIVTWMAEREQAIRSGNPTRPAVLDGAVRGKG
ncbi:DUF1353 domain-containing protein [Sagittula sp. S175]|uniref:DUF1353 domain-containing protein n=1 Tax=Sagittula sp. S175 TaxID=3415129 RepID=UPI003C7A0BE5